MIRTAALALVSLAALVGCATAPSEQAPAPTSSYSTAEQQALKSLRVAADSPEAKPALDSIRDLCTVIARGELDKPLTDGQAGAVYAMCPQALSPRV